MTMMIRAAPYIAAIAIFVGVLAWIVDSSYEHGRKIERLEWMEHEEILKRQADIRVNQAEAKIRMDKELADRRATQIIGAYANEIEKLHTNLADATDHRLYISAKKPICEADRNAMPGSNESTGGDAAEVRFEIPSAIGRAIRGDYFTAAGLEIKHNALIDLIESRPDCFQVVR